MTSSVVPAIGAVVAWLGWEIVHAVVGERIVKVLRPIGRPIWRSFVMARWPWPLMIGVPFGVTGVLEGYSLRNSLTHGTAGIALLFGGAGFSLLTLILWSETRPEAAIARATTSRPERARD